MAGAAPTVVGRHVIGGAAVIQAGHLVIVIDGRNGSGNAARAFVGQELQCHQLDIPVHTGNADTVVAHGADGTGDMGAVAAAVQRIVVVGKEIPANQIINAAIAILIDAIFPADIVQQIAGIDIAIAVEIGNGMAVGAMIEIAESDQAVAIGIDKAQILRNFAGVEPNVQIKIGMGIIDAGIDDADHGFHGAGVAGRPGFTCLAAKNILGGRLVTIHAPHLASGVLGVVGALDRNNLIQFGIADMRTA